MWIDWSSKSECVAGVWLFFFACTNVAADIFIIL